jgi:hypothetical protein
MYFVHESNGTIIAVCSRLEDAEAMSQSVSDEPKKYVVKKEVDKPAK